MDVERAVEETPRDRADQVALYECAEERLAAAAELVQGLTKRRDVLRADQRGFDRVRPALDLEQLARDRVVREIEA